MTPFLFVTDLDNTLVGDERALTQLNSKLSQHRQAHGTKIVYATGRSPQLYQILTTEKTLLEPDALVTSVGTEIFFPGSNTPDVSWQQKISQAWDRDLIVATCAHFADLVPQPDTEQRPFKVSFFLSPTASQEVLPQLESLLHQQGLDVKLIYSTGQDVDILPRYADKGLAVQFLRQQWQFTPEQTVVCGDSGNDISMFAQSDLRGIIVGNASLELLQWHHANEREYHYLAQAYCAGGIVEGLNYFGFLS